MQNPPGPPPGPPSGPPPGSTPGQPSAAGNIDKRTGSLLAYVLWWVTGIILLFVGKNDPDIKFHASQSIIFFGAYSIIQGILSILGGAIGGVIAVGISILSLGLAIFTLIVWILSMVRAWQGGGARFEVPVVGNVVARYADQMAAAVK